MCLVEFLLLIECMKAHLILGSFLLASLVLAETNAERGEYLVNEVAKCGDCHTPKFQGVPDRTRWLQGAKLDLPANCEAPGWAKSAPGITSQLFKHWKDTDVKHFLESGLRPNGKTAAPPMPGYKLRPDDADAMIQYLRSLK